MINKRGKILVNIDWLSIAIVFTLMVVGWLSIYSSVYDENHQSIFDISQRYGKQLLWIIISIPIVFLIFIIDSKFYSTFAYPLYILGIILLIAVLFFGIEVNASKSWFVVGSFRVQPAEFVKFMLSLALARLISSNSFSLNSINSLFKLGVITGLPIALVFLQNDTGTALVYFSLIFVLYREGLNSVLFFTSFAIAALFVLALIIEPAPLVLVLTGLGSIIFFLLSKRDRNNKILFSVNLLFVALSIVFIYKVKITQYPTVVAIAAALLTSITILISFLKNKSKISLLFAFLIFSIVTYVSFVEYAFDNFLQEHQQNRINQILGKHHDPLGVGYNLNQSKIAIGSGGLSGKGFLQGTQTKYNFVPEQSTDFIFCTIGEEFGFIGSLIILILYATLLIRLIFLAERQRSDFSRIYGYCIVSILFFHIVVNLGMTIGLVPIIGIPLPFLSYGGSSLWAFTILVFVFLKLDSNRLEVFR